MPEHDPEMVARRFAKALIRRKWEEIPPLLTASLRQGLTVPEVEKEFAWNYVLPRIRAEWSRLTGEPLEQVPQIDPPRRCEIFSGVEREPPPGHNPDSPISWVQVDFLPSEDSGFDVCYHCFLALVDEDGPHITAFAIEPMLD